jgi:GNAT superfamily N-acetyltransferase
MEVRELTTETERQRAVPLLRQLWSDADPAAILAWTGEDDYTLLGGFVDSEALRTSKEASGATATAELVAVAGVLVRDVLHHERHAWLYDLVVDEPHRGDGFGSELLEHVESWARERDCASVALASPLAKEDVHRYYEARDYERWGYVIEKEL